MDRNNIGLKEQNVLHKMHDVARNGWWDKSDTMTDYFHCAYYYDIAIGKWNKPAVEAK